MNEQFCTPPPGDKSKQRVVAIVQARLGSSRLPLKSLLCLRDQPIIDWVTGRLAKSEKLDHILVALPDTELDDALANHLERRGVDFIRGPENDVLGRFVIAAEHAGADIIVRICADNPLVWSGAIDELVNYYLGSQFDYVWNHIPRDNMWPDGLGAEIVNYSLLRHLDRHAKLPAQREHCFNYIWDNSEQFRMATFDPRWPKLCRPDIKLDVDCPADFLKLSRLPLSPDMDAFKIVELFPLA